MKKTGLKFKYVFKLKQTIAVRKISSQHFQFSSRMSVKDLIFLCLHSHCHAGKRSRRKAHTAASCNAVGTPSIDSFLLSSHSTEDSSPLAALIGKNSTDL